MIAMKLVALQVVTFVVMSSGSKLKHEDLEVCINKVCPSNEVLSMTCENREEKRQEEYEERLEKCKKSTASEVCTDLGMDLQLKLYEINKKQKGLIQMLEETKLNRNNASIELALWSFLSNIPPSFNSGLFISQHDGLKCLRVIAANRHRAENNRCCELRDATLVERNVTISTRAPPRLRTVAEAFSDRLNEKINERTKRVYMWSIVPNRNSISINYSFRGYELEIEDVVSASDDIQTSTSRIFNEFMDHDYRMYNPRISSPRILRTKDGFSVTMGVRLTRAPNVPIRRISRWSCNSRGEGVLTETMDGNNLETGCYIQESSIIELLSNSNTSIVLYPTSVINTSSGEKKINVNLYQYTPNGEYNDWAQLDLIISHFREKGWQSKYTANGEFCFYRE
jgi:hypothetical protein